MEMDFMEMDPMEMEYDQYLYNSDEREDNLEDYLYNSDLSSDCQDESEVPNSQQSNHTTQITLRASTWDLFKWIFIVLNVGIEVCQATFTQENELGKISTTLYMKLSVVTSSLCLMISLVEAIHEGKESKVVWQRRGCFGWLYYPGRQRLFFGRFSLVFGVVSSIIQFCVNLVTVLINKSFVKFETLPLLLSIGYLVAALVDHRGRYMVKCQVHGRCVELCLEECKVDASV